MRKRFPLLLLAVSSAFASAALAWSPLDIVEPSIERLQHCLLTVSDTCPEGATCDEYGEVICGPGEVCHEEEPDCE